MKNMIRHFIIWLMLFAALVTAAYVGIAIRCIAW